MIRVWYVHKCYLQVLEYFCDYILKSEKYLKKWKQEALDRTC